MIPNWKESLVMKGYLETMLHWLSRLSYPKSGTSIGWPQQWCIVREGCQCISSMLSKKQQRV